MNVTYWFFLVFLFVSIYCVGMAWQVQVVAYPLSAIVREEDFLNYHNSYARRATPVIIIPGFLNMLLGILLVFIHPSSIPFWSVIAVAVLAIITLIQTLVVEIPRHKKFEKARDAALLRLQVKTNWLRTATMTAQGLLALWMITQAFTPR